MKESRFLPAWLRVVAWSAVVALGVLAIAVLALKRGEPVNALWLVVAAVCVFAVAYRFHSAWLLAKVLTLDETRATPAVVHEDGKDFVKTNRWVVFGHHFAAIAGPGPLVGPVLAAQFGYLPGMLWMLVGATLGGAVHDSVILFCSIRRRGKSLGQMVSEEVGPFAGVISLVSILAILIILIAVLALVVVNALAESPWGLFTIAATMPIAVVMTEKTQNDFRFSRALMADRAMAIWRKVTPMANRWCFSKSSPEKSLASFTCSSSFSAAAFISSCCPAYRSTSCLSFSSLRRPASPRPHSS